MSFVYYNFIDSQTKCGLSKGAIGKDHWNIADQYPLKRASIGYKQTKID